jgi:ABC-type Fe3+/spermidine/putrescine transport system ATPase subunit
VISTIRPEHIRIVAPGTEPAAAEMHTTATVRDVQYLGSFVRVRAETDSGTRLVADVPTVTGVSDHVAPGQRCTLAWRAEHVRAVGDVSSTNTGREL